jgi:hypothetical protein
MNAPADYEHVRHGQVKAGDLIFIPSLGTHIEIAADSLFLHSDVDTHSSVRRKSSHWDANAVVQFTNVKDRCDYLREHDGVVLREDGYYDNHRVVVYKDDQYVYLRTTMAHAGTSDRVCRKTGKAWKWTETGWEKKDWELRVSGEKYEMGAIREEKLLQASGFYGD